MRSRARVGDVIGERARVMITVKASPEPSKSYGDTVCIAGVRLLNDDSLRWVRIYPVAFRHLATDKQFSKYEVIELDLTRSTTDLRPESHRPNWDSLTRDPSGSLASGARARVLERLIGPTMCELRAGVEADLNAQSLGLVEVADVTGVTFEDHGPWNSTQLESIKRVLGQPDLLGVADTTPVLIPPRFKVKYRYRCGSASCKGHHARILDWELNALQFRFRKASEDELRTIITTKFLDEMFRSDLRTYLYVGNFADIVKRKNFSVLGVYRRHTDAPWNSTLF